MSDPDPRSIAPAQLDNHRQGSTEFVTFFEKFATAIAELDCSEETQVDMLIDRLNQTLSTALTTLSEARKMLLQLDNNNKRTGYS